MAQISIMKKDAKCTIDGYGATVDVSSLANNIWAIQFDSTANTGHIEYTDATANETITSLTSDMEAIVNENKAAKTTEENETQAEIDRLAAIHAGYGYKRQMEYPDIGDQLDALYHAGTFDATMTAAIKAVKDKYPK